jgi:hypothetical protein
LGAAVANGERPTWGRPWNQSISLLKEALFNSTIF